MSQQPAVGRIVHYVSYGTPGGEYTSQCRAAIITETAEMVSDGYSIDPSVPNHGEAVGLAVLNPTGLFFHPITRDGCEHDEDTKAGGTWHWPEYVPGYDPGEVVRNAAGEPTASIPQPDRTPGPDVP